MKIFEVTTHPEIDGMEIGHVLLTPEELNAVPVGVVLTSIGGRKEIKGFHQFDTDTRMGVTAWGFYVPMSKLKPEVEAAIKITVEKN